MLETVLPLDRPLVVFDTETTGTNPRSDRIVEIACVKIHPDGRRETWVKRINPGMPIPAGSTAIHGIRDADVEGLPRFADVLAAPEAPVIIAVDIPIGLPERVVWERACQARTPRDNPVILPIVPTAFSEPVVEK